MSEPIKCSECDRAIAKGEAVWYRPATLDRDGLLTMNPETSPPDNGGLPFHRECLDKRLGD